jgi:4-hydroxythreonine-4-phosphate dehydrogenase
MEDCKGAGDMIIVSMGDANGVGPEILLKAYMEGGLAHPFFVVGDGAALQRAEGLVPGFIKFKYIESAEGIDTGALNIYDLRLLKKEDITPGKRSQKTGDASRLYIKKAMEILLEAKTRAALVTLPISKEAIHYGTPGFTGHTEFIAEMCGQDRYTMMLSSDKLTVTHVSTHVSMKEAIAAVTRERVADVISLTREALLGPLGREPRIAAAGLNAHAGENGLFGNEEAEEIEPAIAAARSQGIDASGPYPPDTVFLRAVKGEFDAVVCMYHDQGHIPLKLLDFSSGVNLTLGLKVIRTSVDHGTAFDIAYKGIADTGSFVKAFNMAAAMLK